MQLASQQLGETEPVARDSVVLSASSDLVGQARHLARQLGCQGTLMVSQGAALAMTDASAERDEAQAFERHVETRPAPPSVTALWKQLGQTGEAPRVTDSSLIDLGAQAGDRIYLEEAALGGTLSDPHLLSFVMAHEQGHVAHRDGVRRGGLQAAVDYFSQEFPGAFGRALQEANRSMELQADEFAAGVTAQAQCDPLPILTQLLSQSSGDEHPDGLMRAEIVRGFHPVPDDVWGQLLEKTAQARLESQRADAQEEALRKAMARMV